MLMEHVWKRAAVIDKTVNTSPTGGMMSNAKSPRSKKHQPRASDLDRSAPRLVGIGKHTIDTHLFKW